MRRLRQISLLIVLASTVEVSTADDAVPDQQSCTDIADGLQRLECYDAALGRTEITAPSEVADGPTPAVDVPSGVGIAAAKVVEKEATPVVVKAEESLGLPEPVAEPAANPEEKKKADELIAVVTNVSQRPGGEHVVTLDNGQVWSEEFSSTYFPVKIGDTVTIKKRRFSGFRLVTASGKGFAVERLR